MAFTRALQLLTVATLAVASPNIVIFMADDLGYGDLGCYGNTSVRTPNIDGLANEGVKMTQHLTAASVCTPSRAAFLTGRYPIRSGMAPTGIFKVFPWPIMTAGLPPSEITFAEQTRRGGYKNGFIGKWHLGSHKDTNWDFKHHPLNQGFDHFYGLLGSNLEDFGGDKGSRVVVNLRPYWYYELLVIWAVTVSALWSLMKMKSISLSAFIFFVMLWSVPVFGVFLIMDNFTLLASFLHRNHELVEQPIRLEGLSQRFVKEGVEFIQNSTMANSPFLLVMSWTHAHVFLKTAKQFEGRSGLGSYGDVLEEMDWSVGEVLKALQREEIENNTLVYFTSDNGGHRELGAEGGYNSILKGSKSHGAPDGGIRVPGLVKWPGIIPKGSVTDEPTSLMDIFNLVSSAAAVDLPADRMLDGKDILPLLKQQTTVSPHEFMYHYCGDEVHAVRYRPRSGKVTWKLVTHEPPLIPGTDHCSFVCNCPNSVKLPKPLLYDMTSDPGENQPIKIDSDVYKNIYDVMLGAINNHKQSIEPVESQFKVHKLLPRLDWQPCCNGTFPFNCYCEDSKYTE